ncbi:MAG: hypothetical protein ACI89D_001608 [Bermanella sp.]|jgi:hypothetical protein
MLPRLILVAAVLFAIAVFVRRANTKPPAERRKYYLTLGISVMAGALILLSLTGRVHWVGALIGALLPFVRQSLPFLLRLIPFIHHQSKTHAASRGASTGNRSEVNTEWLSMRMEHDTGVLSGNVERGAFAGRALDELDLDQLQQIYNECLTADRDSAELLSSYLKHRFGEKWSGPFAGGAAYSSGNISHDQALAVLGLKQGADREAIIKAHRSLMQKLHPDRGGNDYLAAQINLAKDVLLGD